jgi:uncharacterized sodium:solute symporter family permease YidK
VNRASFSFAIVIAAMLLITAWKPLAKPLELRSQDLLELTPSRPAKIAGILVATATIALYIYFF